LKISLKFILSIMLIVLMVLLQGCNPDEFYTHDLVKAQAKIPFRIIIPTYFPGNAKERSLPSIQGIINKKNNNIEVHIRYVLYRSEAFSDITIIESNHPFDLGDPKLNSFLVSTEILGRQVVKQEFNSPLGPGSAFSFKSGNIYFVVVLANFPKDEAMKIVESIISQGAVPETGEIEAVPETGRTEAVPEPDKKEVVLETEIVLEPDISSTALLPENAIADTIAVIEARLDSFGITGATVKKQDEGLIVVQLPKVEDIDQVVALITSRGELDFREQVLDAQGQPVLAADGNQQWAIAKAKGSDGQEKELTGRYLKPNTEVVIAPVTNEPKVAFEWNEEGAILFEQITQRNLMKPLGIFLNNKLLSAPEVRAVIKDKGVITGLSPDEARTLAIQLNSGVLPLPLRVVRIVSIGKD
jgi:hypothetical protein